MTSQDDDDDISDDGIAQNDLTGRIERLEAFEERCGIRLDALFAKGDDRFDLTVNGEIHPSEGAKLKQDIVLKVDVYDSARRLLSSKDEWFFADGFFGFATFSFQIYSHEAKASDISKIRIYPKPV